MVTEGLPPCGMFGHCSVSSWEWPSLLVSSRSNGGPSPPLVSALPEGRRGPQRPGRKKRAQEGVKQVGLQVSQEKDPRRGDCGNFISATYKCDDCSRH